MQKFSLSGLAILRAASTIILATQPAMADEPKLFPDPPFVDTRFMVRQGMSRPLLKLRGRRCSP
jgi:hypothetical protein